MVELIDAHHHLWHYGEEDFGWLDSKIHPSMEELKRDYLPEDLRQELATAGVDGSVAVQARQSLQETHWLLACAKRMPAIRGVVGWVPLASPKLHEILNSLAGEPKLKGLRHVVQDEPDEFLSGADFNRGVAALGGTGLVYDILIYERQLPQTLDFARRHPGQSFVLDHLAKPGVRERELEPWQAATFESTCAREPQRMLQALRPGDRSRIGTRGRLRICKPYLDTALEAFGPDRLDGWVRLAGVPGGNVPTSAGGRPCTSGAQPLTDSGTGADLRQNGEADLQARRCRWKQLERSTALLGAGNESK